MRARHVVAVVAVILVGIGMKLAFFAAPTAEAHDAQLHPIGKNLPELKFQDMSVIFPGNG
jgi:hypothetical protein